MINETNANAYCSEDISNIENYSTAIADINSTWVCHHRREIIDGVKWVTADELKKQGLYYHRPADELIFLKNEDHVRLHMSIEEARINISNHRKGKALSSEHRQKLSESHKGLISGFLGKQHSLETKQKISSSCKGRTPPNKGKRMSEEQKMKIRNSILNRRK